VRLTSWFPAGRGSITGRSFVGNALRRSAPLRTFVLGLGPFADPFRIGWGGAPCSVPVQGVTGLAWAGTLGCMRAGTRTTRHRRGRSRACSILLALVATCVLPASAQAVAASVPDAAGAAVGQVQGSVDAAAGGAQGNLGAVPAAAATSAQPVVAHVAETAAAAAAPTRPAVETARRMVETAAAPAVSPGTDAATPVRPATPSAPAPAAERDRPAHRAPPEAASPKPHRTPVGPTEASGAAKRQRLAMTDGPAASKTPSSAASASNGAALDREPASQDDGVPAGPGSTASVSSTSFTLGALALLAAALLLAGPAAGRRLRVDRAFARPTLFMSVLERPG
jgi:hypothetical protein